MSVIPYTKVFIIAEAGVNHNGDLRKAFRLIDAAVAAGCDAVKFQTFKAEKLVSINASKARYQKITTGEKGSQFEMLKKLELDKSQHQQLSRHCRRQGIIFLSTPFDENSVDLLEQIGVSIYKVPSGEITNLPLLKYVALKKKPIILSTGMSTLEEVKRAVKTITSAGNSRITVLHCVTAYPAPVEQANLRAIQTLAGSLKLPVGYSDHTEGLDAVLAAVALGARVIEKHFTLDKNLPGPDHKASLEPGELKEMVARIRLLEKALGDGIKRPVPCEIENITVVRKSVIAAHTLIKGQKISRGDLAIKRPGNGIQPADINKVIGCKVRKNIEADKVLTWKDIQ
jgi:N-acetylneuraminate synthase/N,N'-diacetyllegionaminate synthase